MDVVADGTLFQQPANLLKLTCDGTLNQNKAIDKFLQTLVSGTTQQALAALGVRSMQPFGVVIRAPVPSDDSSTLQLKGVSMRVVPLLEMLLSCHTHH